MKVSRLLIVAAVTLFITACASYRTDTDVTFDSTEVDEVSSDVMILEGDLEDKKYTVIGPIEGVVKKLSLFHKDPTEEQVNIVLIEKAKEMGADAIINVVYEDGVGFSTWGYVKAEGTAVKTQE